MSQTKTMIDHKHLTKRMRYLSDVIDKFWKRWREEYLVELRESHRHSKGTSDPDPIAVGDIVLVHSENKRRGFWKLAKVEDLITGQDGAVRAAVRVGRSTILRRPLQRIYPLEINCREERNQGQEDTEDIDADRTSVIDPDQVSNRPRRAAAQEASENTSLHLVGLTVRTN